MMIDVHCQVTSRDYVQAQYLHMRPRPWIGFVGIGLAMVFMIAFVVSFISLLLVEGTGSAWTIVLLTLAVGLYFTCVYLLYLPWRARRIYRQLKALHSPFRMRLSEEGVFAENEHGQSLLPWSHVLKWKEGRHLFLIYHAEVLFQLIPKRCLASESDTESLRELLKSHANQEV